MLEKESVLLCHRVLLNVFFNNQSTILLGETKVNLIGLLTHRPNKQVICALFMHAFDE